MDSEKPIPIFSFKPEEDGISHINIYSNGKTPLGRFLTHFAPVAVLHPKLGSFSTMENFYHYVRTGCKEEAFRTMSPLLVKVKSRQYLDTRPSDFDDMIRDMNRSKVLSNQKAYLAFIRSMLPFDHYYMMTDKKTGLAFKVRPREADKFVIMFECMRIDLRKNYDDAQASIANLCNGTSGLTKSN